METGTKYPRQHQKNPFDCRARSAGRVILLAEDGADVFRFWRGAPMSDSGPRTKALLFFHDPQRGIKYQPLKNMNNDVWDWASSHSQLLRGWRSPNPRKCQVPVGFTLTYNSRRQMFRNFEWQLWAHFQIFNRSFNDTDTRSCLDWPSSHFDSFSSVFGEKRSPSL